MTEDGPSGVVFPRSGAAPNAGTPDSTDAARSTSALGRSVVADALRAC